MKNKYVVCTLVSLTLSMFIPLFFIDDYEPLESYASEKYMNSTDLDTQLIHETRKLSYFEKVVFYFSSLNAFIQYLNMVWVWFMSMLIASFASTYLNHKIAK